jgi:hypothetical protein
MTRDERQRAGKQDTARLLVRPWGGARRMRQRDEVKALPGILGRESGADDLIEFSAGHELEDGELADGDDEAGTKEFHFGLEPSGAIEDFVGIRYAVAADRPLAGKAAADCRHVNARAEGRLIDAGMFVKPAKKFFAGRPRERAAQYGFLVAGGLADEKDATEDRASADHGLLHLRTTATAEERGDVPVERGLKISVAHGKRGRPGMR